MKFIIMIIIIIIMINNNNYLCEQPGAPIESTQFVTRGDALFIQKRSTGRYSQKSAQTFSKKEKRKSAP